MSQPPDPDVLSYARTGPQHPPRIVCQSCGVPMIQGVILNQNAGRQLWRAGEWMRKFLGIRKPPKGLDYEVICYRCPSCGRLEHYAPAG